MALLLIASTLSIGFPRAGAAGAAGKARRSHEARPMPDPRRPAAILARSDRSDALRQAHGSSPPYQRQNYRRSPAIRWTICDCCRHKSVGTVVKAAGCARATSIAPLILTASSASNTGLAKHLIGFHNYVRLNATVPPGAFALDRIDPNKVAGYAATVSRNLSPEYVDKFTDHTAGPYEPLPSRERHKDAYGLRFNVRAPFSVLNSTQGMLLFLIPI